MAVLTTVLLALHLLAVNVASAVPLVCVWLHARGRSGDACADQTGRRLANASVGALIVGALFGALLVGLAWWNRSSGYWQAVERFPLSAYAFAAAELAFSFVCLWIYARTWDSWRDRPWLHALLAVMSVTNLLYHLPPLMIVLGELSAHPRLTDDEAISHEVFRQLMMRSDVLSHVAHFAIASVAVAGWALMGVAFERRKAEGGRLQADVEVPRVESGGFDRLISGGAWIALAASLSQLAVGLWVLVEMPIGTRNMLLGNDWLATSLFFVGIVGTFALLHLLATVALGDTNAAAVRRSMLLMMVIVLLMVGALVRVRRLDGANPGFEMLASGSASPWNEPLQRANESTAWAARLPHRPPRAVPF